MPRPTLVRNARALPKQLLINEIGFFSAVIELLYKGYIRRSAELENDFIN
jgi:hypothetical protein